MSINPIYCFKTKTNYFATLCFEFLLETLSKPTRYLINDHYLISIHYWQVLLKTFSTKKVNNLGIIPII